MPTQTFKAARDFLIANRSDHAAACAECEELVAAAAAMRSLGASREGDSGLPDPAWFSLPR